MFTIMGSIRMKAAGKDLSIGTEGSGFETAVSSSDTRFFPLAEGKLKAGVVEPARIKGAEADFKKLLEPLEIKQIRFRNRMVKPAQVLGFAAGDGNASSMLIDFYETLAKGGVGMIIVESTCVDYPIGGRGPNRLRIDQDAFIPSLARLAEAIHSHGCPTFLQLSHTGPNAHFSGLQPLAASALSREEIPVSDPRVKNELPQAMTLSDIDRCVEKFAEAALRARHSGFDGVEFHGGHHLLINSFLSRAWNRRAGNPITVKLKDGKTFENQVNTPRGTPEAPLTLRELSDKYRDCAQRVLSHKQVERSIELLLALENVKNINDLMNVVTEGQSS